MWIFEEPSPIQPTDQAGSAGSGTADDVMYKEKVRELQVYLDHLKRTLEQQQRDGSKNF